MKRIISLIVALVLVACGLQVLVKTEVKANTGVKRYTVLVLDTSAESRFVNSKDIEIYTARTALPDVKIASSKFLDDISVANGNNYVAVVSYQNYADTVSDFTTEYETLKNKINGLYEYSNTRNISKGLDRAYELLDSISEKNVIKNIVIFTTGMTNAGNYSYSGKYNEDTVGSSWYNSSTDVNLYAYANFALQSADKIKNQGINLYSIGLFGSMANMPSEGKEITEFFQLTTSDLATSKDYFYPVYDADDLQFTFGEVADDIVSQPKEIKFTYSGKNTATCYYSDDYFSKSSYTYNPSLATMSISFAMSAFGSSDGGQSDYSNKSNNARKLLEDIGVNPNAIGTNDWFKKKPTTDSIGVIIGNKKITVKDKDYTLIAIAVRGGGYEQEWASNFTIGQSGQHQGFNNAKNDVIKYIKEYINKQNVSGSVKFWITGFSRAAATANLVSGELDKGVTLNSNISYSNDDIYSYCFETPAGALTNNVIFNTTYNNIFNIINQSDPVPYVAPAALGFCRYGIDRYLPSLESNPREYNTLKSEMLIIYNELPTTKHYIVDDFQMKKIQLKNWLPFGEKISFVQDDTYNNYSQGIFLTNYVTILSKEFIIDRNNYVLNYQNEIREVCSVIFGCTDEQSKTMLDSIVKQAKNEWSYLLGSFIWNTRVNPWVTKDEVLKIISKWLKQAINDAGVTSYNEETINSAVTKLADLLPALIINHPNYFTTAVINGSGLASAHFPELCYSWLASMDSNYVGTVKSTLNTGGYRIVRINCDVDVNVYDNNGNNVASITNEKPDDSHGFICGVDDNGQKYVVLPVDETFSIDIKGRTNDNVNYSINEYSALAGEYTRSVNYFNVDVKKGESLTGYIPAYFDKDELDGLTLEGSTVDYSLYDCKDNLIECDSDMSGKEVKDAYYTVKLISTNDENGSVVGSGIYQYGQFAKIQAIPYEGYSFDGWYKNEELLSKDMEYRICVLNDYTITGKFVKNNNMTNTEKSVKNNIPKTIKLTKTKYTYDGKIKTPSVIVFDDNGHKVSSDNYTLEYSKGRKKVGKYSIKVIFKNKYTGEKTLYFKIIPKNTKISKIVGKEKTLTIKWKKQNKQTNGYQIQLSTNKKFKKSIKSVTIKKNKTVKTTFNKLKSKKKYHVRIRTYKTVKINGKKVKLFSNWSKAKTSKTK